MSFILIKSHSGDFTYGVSLHRLRRDLLDAGITYCNGCTRDGDTINIYFVNDYTADNDTINQVITNHRPTPTCFDDLKWVTVTSNYQMVNKSVFANTSAGSFTVKLPNPRRMNAFIFAVLKTSAASTLTIDPFAAETINGLASIQLNGLKSYIMVRSDGVNWYSVNDDTDVSVNVGVPESTTRGDITVDSGDGPAPFSVGTNGQVIIADSSQPLGVRWADLTTSGYTSTSTEVTSTTVTTTTSNAYTLLASMTITPSAGNYVVMFSGSGGTSSASASMYYSVYVGGTIVLPSERLLKAATSAITPLYTQAKVTANGSQAIEVRVKTSTGTFTINTRSLLIIGVA
jgi:hypothetical protein